MRSLYMKQKVISLRERFTVKDEDENDVYYVEGSFMRIPKTFTMWNRNEEEVAHITKKTFSFLPTFHVEAGGREVFTIKKELSFLKPRYTIDGEGIEVSGNWLDMDFQALQDGEIIGQVNQKWLSWGDSYEIKIWQEEMEAAIIALVIAIDYVKAQQSATAGWAGGVE